MIAFAFLAGGLIVVGIALTYYVFPWDGKTSCGPPILMMQAS